MHSLQHTLDSLGAAADRHLHDPLLFVAAFDGVLAAYDDDPDAVRISTDRQRALRRLQQLPDVTVGVFSGRPLTDVRARIDLGDDAFYVGLHGLEIAGPEFTWTPPDVLESYSGAMEEIAAGLREILSHLPGVRLEWKGPVIAVHTRQASSENAVWSRFQLLRAAADLVNNDAVQTVRGHDVLELVPNVGFSGAEALRTIRQRVEGRQERRVFTVYVGADAADDSALYAVGAGGVSAVVGRRSRAEYRFESPEEVDALVSRLTRDRRR